MANKSKKHHKDSKLEPAVIKEKGKAPEPKPASEPSPKVVASLHLGKDCN